MFAALLLAVSIASAPAPAGEALKPPEDGKQYATIVFTLANCRGCKDEQLLGWLEADSRLKSLKSTTHFHHFRPHDQLWRERFGPSHDGTSPAIWIQDFSGGVVFKASGSKVPDSATILADMIEDRFAELGESACPDCGPDPQPSPQPTPQVGPLEERRPWFVRDTSRPRLLPDLFAPVRQATHRITLLALVLLALVALFFQRPPDHV